MKTLNKILAIVIIMLAISSIQAISQNIVTRQSGINASFYTTVDDAIAAAANGDYIYIPGGVWAISNVIHVGVNIVGVGYNPDSSSATTTTRITSNGWNGIIRISSGCDNGSFTGVQFLHTVAFGGDESNGSVVINNYSFSRCRFSGGNSNWCDNNAGLIMGWCGNGQSTNLFLSENVFDNYVNGEGISGVTATKNVFSYNVNGFNASSFNNNLFIAAGQWKCNYINNSFFNNNIVIDNNGNPNFVNSNCYGNVLNNNMYNEPNTQGPYSNTEIHGLFSATPIFVNFTTYSFDVAADYHLAAGCFGKCHDHFLI